MVKYFTSRAFITDPKDVWNKETTIGLTEHAARVHAPPLVYDRRGNVIYWDDYESPNIKFYPEIKGSGIVQRVTGYIYSSPDGNSQNNVGIDWGSKFGNYSLMMKCSSGQYDYTSIYYVITDFHIGKLGAQFSFATREDGGYITLGFVYYDGDGEKWMGSVDYYLDTGMLKYLGEDSFYHNIATIPYFTGYSGEKIPYGTIKLVVDLSTKKYVRALFFGREIDLSTYDMYHSPFSGIPSLFIRFWIRPTDSVSRTVYVDNFVLTENEP